MIPEAPFLFSIAALSASLAGLAGLVVGLRRGSEMTALDMFRLRQMVEFSFANVIFSIGLIPLAATLESTETAVRLGAAATLAYGLGTGYALARRAALEGIPWTRGWTVGVLLINAAMLGLAASATLSGSIATYELLLVFLLVRPMFVFLLVIAGFGHKPPP